MTVGERGLFYRLEVMSRDLRSLVFLVALVSVAFLVQSEKGVDKALAQCQFEAAKVFPDVSFPLKRAYMYFDHSGQQMIDKDIQFIGYCMNVAGYKHRERGQNGCVIDTDFADTVNPSCYKSDSFFGWHWFDFRVWFEREIAGVIEQ